MNIDGVLPAVIEIVYIMLALAMILTFIRLVRGPTLPDRVVALDLFAVITVGFISVYAIDVDQSVFLDVGLVVALITFLGSVAFARYLERRVSND